jgi:hypothetical protein
VDAVNKHSAASKEDVFVGMTKEAFLNAVHGGQISYGNQSLFYAGNNTAVVVAFNDQDKIEKIVEVSLPEQKPSVESMMTIAEGDDLATVFSVTGIAAKDQFGGMYDLNKLFFNTCQGELYCVRFDANGLVESVYLYDPFY